MDRLTKNFIRYETKGIIMESKQDKTALDDIETIWEQWKNSGHRFRSSHAMVKINKILMEMEV